MDLDQQDGIDDGETKDVDWKVTVGPQHTARLTRKGRARSDTLAILRVVHTQVDGKVRTHHHTAKRRSEEHSSRPFAFASW